MHGLSEFVTVTHRDVCGEGFPLSQVVDAVFLDLPKPWECISSAKNAMKKEGNQILLLFCTSQAAFLYHQDDC